MSNIDLSTAAILTGLRAGSDDETEAVGAMQLLSNDVLIAASSGRLDLNRVAAELLAGRAYKPRRASASGQRIERGAR